MAEWLSWVMPILAILTVAYNTIVTHAVLKNDVKHLKEEMNQMREALNEELKCVREKVDRLVFHLLDDTG